MIEAEKKLSKPGSKAGRLQRACLDLLREHEAAGAIPTSIRFLFYELLDRGVVPKVYRDENGVEKKRTPSQDISDAVTVLRELDSEPIPWGWIVDETRTLEEWRYAASMYHYVEEVLPVARIDLWGARSRRLSCASRALWLGCSETSPRTTSAPSPLPTARPEASCIPRLRRSSKVVGACSTWAI